MPEYRKTSYVETIKSGFGGDGQDVSVSTTTYLYNERGKLVEEIYNLDSSNDGSVDASARTFYTYRKHGSLSSKLNEVDNGNDGRIDSSTESIYDRQGKLIREIGSIDRNGDGDPDPNSIKDLAYDRSGNLIREVARSPDWSEDGHPDYETVTDYTYDKRSHLISYDTLRYMDGESAGPNEYVSYDAVYDKNGHLIHEEVDDPMSLDFVISRDYEYDGRGRLATETSYDPFDYGDDGKGVLHYSYHHGNKLARIDYAIVLGGEEPDFQPLATYDYDNKDRLIEKRILANVGDLYNDGQAGIYLYEYSKRGVLIGEQHDYGANGTIDYEYTRSPLEPDAPPSEILLLA